MTNEGELWGIGALWSVLGIAQQFNLDKEPGMEMREMIHFTWVQLRHKPNKGSSNSTGATEGVGTGWSLPTQTIPGFHEVEILLVSVSVLVLEFQEEKPVAESGAP